MKLEAMQTFSDSTTNEAQKLLQFNFKGANGKAIEGLLRKLMENYYNNFKSIEQFEETLLNIPWTVKPYNNILKTNVYSAKVKGSSKVVPLELFPEDTTFAVVDMKSNITQMTGEDFPDKYIYKIVTNSKLTGSSIELDLFVDGMNILAISPNNSGNLPVDGCLISDKRILLKRITKSQAISYGFTEVISINNIKTNNTTNANMDIAKLRMKMKEAFTEITEESVLGIKLKNMVKGKYYNTYDRYKSFTELKHALLLSEFKLVKTQGDLSLLTSSVTGELNVHPLSSLTSLDVLLLLPDANNEGKSKLYVINKKATSDMKTCILVKGLENEPKVASIDIGGLYDCTGKEVGLHSGVIDIPTAKNLGFTCAVNKNIEETSNDFVRISLLKALITNRTIVQEFYNRKLSSTLSFTEFLAKLALVNYKIHQDRSIYLECEIVEMLSDYVSLDELSKETELELNSYNVRLGRIPLIRNAQRKQTKSMVFKLNKNGNLYKITDIYAGEYITSPQLRNNDNCFNVGDLISLGFSHAYILD